jgi:uncharacterized protein (DUF342 family)
MGDSSGEILQTNVLLDRSGIIIETDKRGMVCYFTYVPSSAMPKLTIPVIKAALSKAGVVYGIIEEEINGLSGRDEEIRNLVIARGRKPVLESEARLEYLFSTDPYSEFKKSDDDKDQIDFRERGQLPFVKAGEPVARIVMDKDPTPGKSITGQDVHPEYHEQEELEPGKNVRVENKLFLAQIEGAPRLDKLGRVEVSPEWIVAGDVDIKTGNIIYPGKLRVKGVIQPGYHVEAESIHVNGIENRTVVETKKNLIVDGGIQGGRIHSGGRLEARFINNATVTAISDVEVKLSIINSDVRTSGALAAQTIFGGSVAALKGVTCINLSSEANRTTVIFGVDPIREENISKLVRQKIEVEETISILREKIGTDLETYERVQKLKEDINIHMSERDALQQRKDATDPEDESSLEFFDGRLEELDEIIKPIDDELKANERAANNIGRKYMNELMELKRLGSVLLKLDEAHSRFKVIEDESGVVPKVIVKGKALIGTRISSSHARSILKKEFQRVVFSQRRTTEAERKHRRALGKYHLAVDRL